MRTYFDLLYAGEQALDLYLPEEEDFDLFIYFHGGGLEKGDKKDASKFAKDLTSLVKTASRPKTASTTPAQLPLLQIV